MKTKEEIRKEIKEKLKNTKENTKIYKSNIIQKELIRSSKSFKNIFCYIETKDEVITTDFINIMLSTKKRILVPKIINWNIFPIEIKSLDKLKIWSFDILEPIDSKIYKWEIDLAVVPWLAFTKNWKRIWRWKWFYDKFFSNNKNIFKIWICFDFQIIKDLKTEIHDIYMNKVIYN